MKISVIIAAYASPPALDSLVASLDAQTANQSDFEVFFVDDGSPDDTLDRLRSIAAVRPNYRVETIPNSGWPGRPRNTAMALTDADYVFFADHDDYFFPDALRRMAEFASETKADVIHTKEVVWGWSAPGWSCWNDQRVRTSEWQLTELQCITPHKLYRMDFLRDNSILFPEGRIRLEDYAFNGDAWSATDSVAILADTPVYAWNLYDANSHKGGYDLDVYWDSFDRSMRDFVKVRDTSKRHVLEARWYRSRILDRVGPQFLKYSAAFRDDVYPYLRARVSNFSEETDALLPPNERLRSSLLRQDRREDLETLAALDTSLKLDVQSTGTTWSAGVLRVGARLTILDQTGSPLLFRRDGATALRVLPTSMTAGVSDAVLDHSLDLESLAAEMVIRGRADSVDWVLPTTVSVDWVAAHGDFVYPVAEVTAEIDPRSAAFGRALSEQVWVVFARWQALGYTATHRVRTDGIPAGAALVDGQQYIAYRTGDGFLALDVGSTARTVVGTAAPAASEVEIIDTGRRVSLKRVHVFGTSTLQATYVGKDGAEYDAQLVGADGLAHLRVSGDDLTLAGGQVRIGSKSSARLWAKGGVAGDPPIETTLTQGGPVDASSTTASGELEKNPATASSAAQSAGHHPASDSGEAPPSTSAMERSSLSLRDRLTRLSAKFAKKNNEN